jgi:hypothetical protein
MDCVRNKQQHHGHLHKSNKIIMTERGKRLKEEAANTISALAQTNDMSSVFCFN